MGRAIKMENELDILKGRVAKLENIVRGMSHTISEKKNIDLIEETKGAKKNVKKKKTNNETSSSSDKHSDNGGGEAKE